jgi:hypothetical protein
VRKLDQKVDVAAARVLAARHRTEDAEVVHTTVRQKLEDANSFLPEDLLSFVPSACGHGSIMPAASARDAERRLLRASRHLLVLSVARRGQLHAPWALTLAPANLTIGGLRFVSSALRDAYARSRLTPGLRDPVQHVGVQIGAVRPHDRLAVFVNGDLLEQSRIAERLEDRSTEQWLDVDISNLAAVSYKQLRSHETTLHLVFRLLV